MPPATSLLFKFRVAREQRGDRLAQASKGVLASFLARVGLSPRGQEQRFQRERARSWMGSAEPGERGFSLAHQAFYPLLRAKSVRRTSDRAMTTSCADHALQGRGGLGVGAQQLGEVGGFALARDVRGNATRSFDGLADGIGEGCLGQKARGHLERGAGELEHRQGLTPALTAARCWRCDAFFFAIQSSTPQTARCHAV